MSRILADDNGSYDLSHVSAVTRIPWANKIAGQLQSSGSTAKLHFYGGQAISTLLPFDEVHADWLDVKEAENHPVDHSLVSRALTTSQDD